jgi:hypothetical protein
MSPPRKTLALALLALLLLLINLVDAGTTGRLAADRPVLAAVDRDTASRIEIASALEKVVLQGTPTGKQGVGEDKVAWALAGPITGDADPISVRNLLAVFRKETPLDARVDTGNFDTYGLDAGNGILVEIWQGGEAPHLSLTVGNDGPNGTSYVRLSGSDAVYRARVGGRARYAKAAAEWRNRRVFDLDPPAVASLELSRPGQAGLRLVRTEDRAPAAGAEARPGWVLDPDPGFPTDPVDADALIAGLCGLRVGAFLPPEPPPGFDPPLATLTLTATDGAVRRVDVGGSPPDGAFLLRVEGRPELLRVARAPIAAALVAPEALRDRTLLRFERTSVDTLAFESPRLPAVLLQQDLATNLWSVLQPANVDVDLKLVFFMVNTLAELRAESFVELPPAAVGLSEPQATITARFLDGSGARLRVGRDTSDARGRPVVFVSVDGKDGVYTIPAATWDKLRAGFGR